jgi:class 3 adenylate cyclase/2-polyprenyl-3-methyl-5-hydroxy-6-metoxy-1,4-benzoquinol methylase
MTRRRAQRPEPAQRTESAPTALSGKFSELLASLGIDFPSGASRPVLRNERLAEEVMAAFLDVSGAQLVQVLKGEQTFSPLHQLEVLVSLFYGTIDDVYVGVDSHPPSLFLKVHPFLLETLAANDASAGSGGAGGGSQSAHDECHGARRVRIVPLSERSLQSDFDRHEDIAGDYFSQHEEHGVMLLSVKPEVREQARNDTLRGESTGDLGIWLNTAALLFASSMDAVNNRLELQLVYAGDERGRFNRCLRYVRRLIEDAKVVRLRGKRISTEELDQQTRDHLLWNLETMFEPRLADVWDEFVAAPKRINGLGPFVDGCIKQIGVERAKILDAATGTGCESIYLLGKGHSVTSNEIEHRLIVHARESAAASGVQLDVTRFDWRHFEHLAAPDTFDVVLALGNSLSCLSTEADVRMVLARFAHLLRPNGLLIVDERNYPAIFKHARRMRRPDFRFPGRVVYCSQSIQARPEELPGKAGLDNEMLRLEYMRGNERVGRFDVFPFAEDQLQGLLEDSGFRSVKRFYDLEEPNGNSDSSEFITYVASRSFVESGVHSGRSVEIVVAFTDITGSILAKRRLGETRYAKEWRRHEARVTETAAAGGGRIVTDTGDGFIFAFQSAADAVECIARILSDPGTTELVVRGGINQGSVLQDDRGNLRGREVDVAARICDQARPNLLIVDDRVKLATPEHEWASVGTVELKGAGARQLWRLEDPA